VISIRGTVLSVDVGPSEETLVHVETGVVSVRHRLMPGGEVTIQSGESIQIMPNIPLAALRRTTPLAIAGKVLRAAGETAVRVRQTTAASGGSKSPAPGSSSGGSSSGPPPPASDSGSNEPAPPPGEDKGNAPPGDVIP